MIMLGIMWKRFSGRRQTFLIKQDLFKKINDFSAAHDVTPFMLVRFSAQYIIIALLLSRRHCDWFSYFWA